MSDDEDNARCAWCSKEGTMPTTDRKTSSWLSSSSSYIFGERKVERRLWITDDAIVCTLVLSYWFSSCLDWFPVWCSYDLCSSTDCVHRKPVFGPICKQRLHRTHLHRSTTKLSQAHTNKDLTSFTHRPKTVGNAIDKKLLSTINKILIDKLSIRSFCY